MKKNIHIIGMGLSPGNLTAEHLKLIHGAAILIGGRRLLNYFPDSPANKMEIHHNLGEIIAFLQDALADSAAEKAIVVLASGDPLFFGIGSLLARELGRENIVIHPNISSVAAAFAAIGESWQDAVTISLHGRAPAADFFEAIAARDKIAVLTDPRNNPAHLAQMLIESGAGDFHMCVLEQLGSPGECITWHSPREAREKTFEEPNLVILKRLPASAACAHPPLHAGMPEDCFAHQRGLITKAEIRAVTLSKLRLFDSRFVLWDLGAGSGSVSIEAAAFIKSGKIIAVEQHAPRIEQIQANRERFAISNLDIVQARLPEGIEQLAPPDRVFIGGGGKDLETIIQAAARRLRPQGVIVINTVLLKTIDIALNTFKSEGFETEIVQVQVSRGQAMPYSERLEAQNPVWIISGFKTNKETTEQ